MKENYEVRLHNYDARTGTRRQADGTAVRRYKMNTPRMLAANAMALEKGLQRVCGVTSFTLLTYRSIFR